MSAASNFMNIFFPEIGQRQAIAMNRAIAAEREKQLSSALEPFISRNIISEQQVPFQADSFGPEDPINQLRGLSNVEQTVTQTPGIPQDQASALAKLFAMQKNGGAQLGALLMSQNQPEKLTGDVAQFMQARQTGIIPPDMQFQDFLAMSKKPLVQNNVGGALPFKIPSGFMLRDAADPNSGVIPIPGGPAERKSPEQAGRGQMIADSIQNIRDIRDRVLRDGTADRLMITLMNSGVGEGRDLRSKMRDAIAAKLRLETGAQANEQELADMERRFGLSIIDDDATVKSKLDRLERFMKGSLKQTNPELFDALKARAHPPSDTKRLKFNPQTGRLE